MEIRQHALLYALICKRCFEEAPEEAEDLVKKITVAYGSKRGQRMAELTGKEGHDLDLDSFFVHGEWKGKDNENLSEMSYEKDRTISRVSRCAWYETWKESDLLEYGSYYCRYIDKAICEGYDGDFSLDVKETLSHGDKECVFIWNRKADRQLIEKRRDEAKGEWIKDFDFHCKELYECAKDVLKDKKKILDLISKDYEMLQSEEISSEDLK